MISSFPSPLMSYTLGGLPSKVKKGTWDETSALLIVKTRVVAASAGVGSQTMSAPTSSTAAMATPHTARLVTGATMWRRESELDYVVSFVTSGRRPLRLGHSRSVV